jgi:Family of unknown function (DUF5678)
MSSATLERILDEVKRLTPEERHQLRKALEREAVQAFAPPSADAENDRWEREQRWLDEHRDEYVGQWVALEGDHLLASGPDGRAVYEAARGGRPRPIRDARRAARRAAVRGVVKVPHSLDFGRLYGSAQKAAASCRGCDDLLPGQPSSPSATEPRRTPLSSRYEPRTYPAPSWMPPRPFCSPYTR